MNKKGAKPEPKAKEPTVEERLVALAHALQLQNNALRKLLVRVSRLEQAQLQQLLNVERVGDRK